MLTTIYDASLSELGSRQLGSHFLKCLHGNEVSTVVVSCYPLLYQQLNSNLIY